jgi:hypothetical protein
LSAKSRNWLILLLTIFSIVCISAHRYGLFQIELNLLSPENSTAVFEVKSGNLEQSLEVNENQVVMECHVRALESLKFVPSPFC